jgi:hypothetical protein
MNNYYVYVYLRENGAPYYIGKGKLDRAYIKNKRIKPPPDKSRILIPLRNLTNEQACYNEVEYIKYYGRKDLGTGILRNMTNGGEGAPGRVLSEETKKKISISNSKPNGRVPWNKGTVMSTHIKEKLWEGRDRFIKENGGPPNRGIPMSDNQKEYLRNRWLGTKRTTEELKRRKVQCVHCLLIGDCGAMKRWHFDNCRSKV